VNQNDPQVVSLTDDAPQDVYDISVEGTHCFFANEILVHNCHHQTTAFSWQAVASMCRAPRRIGLSGTPYKDDRSRFDLSYLHPTDGWLRAYTGETLVYISPAMLQDVGKLTKCRLISFPAGGEQVESFDWHTVYTQGVIDNPVRNFRITNLVSNLVDLGGKPLVSVEKLRHGRILQRLLLARGIVVACSYGQGVLIVPDQVLESLPPDTPTEGVPVDEDFEGDVIKSKGTDGKKMICEVGFVRIPVDVNVKKLFRNGVIKAIIGSRIYDESMDIPELTDLINASGGKASQRFRQKIGRILRLFKGKALATIWDPWDSSHVFLRIHSKKRMEIAKSEGYEIINSPVPECLYRFRDFRITVNRRVDMKLKEIYVEVSMTIPTAQYVNIKPSVGLRAELEEGEDVGVAHEQLSRQTMVLFMREMNNQAYWNGQTTQKGAQAAAAEFLGMLSPQ
jgi:hypothetical protein